MSDFVSCVWQGGGGGGWEEWGGVGVKGREGEGKGDENDFEEFFANLGVMD